MEKFMRSFPIKAMQADQPEKGRLKVHVTTEAGAVPVPDARVSVSYTGEQGQPLQEVSTDSSGNTPELELSAPPLEYSVEPGEQQPYSEYTLSVTAPGFEPVEVVGTEILPDVTALQEIRMLPQQGEAYERFVIPAHTLFGNYPPKIAEPEIQPTNETGEIVLSRVVVPEYVIVHDGVPTDSTAANYWVKYRDYIKNVASSEIYATWTDAAIRANVLAIMSFTLNRVYTEFYRNRGYDYLSRPNVKQPILTQYCDGRRVTCPEWMSQWGSQALGEQGYSAIQILRSYYGESMYINTAEEISGVPYSWPGSNLTEGSRGQKVLQLQEQLNRIAKAYPAMPKISEDGIYGPATANSVRAFQAIFGLPETGIVDYPTWYKVSEIYVAVSRIAELNP